LQKTCAEKQNFNICRILAHRPKYLKNSALSNSADLAMIGFFIQKNSVMPIRNGKLKAESI